MEAGQTAPLPGQGWNEICFVARERNGDPMTTWGRHRRLQALSVQMYASSSELSWHLWFIISWRVQSLWLVSARLSYRTQCKGLLFGCVSSKFIFLSSANMYIQFSLLFLSGPHKGFNFLTQQVICNNSLVTGRREGARRGGRAGGGCHLNLHLLHLQFSHWEHWRTESFVNYIQMAVCHIYHISSLIPLLLWVTPCTLVLLAAHRGPFI